MSEKSSKPVNRTPEEVVNLLDVAETGDATITIGALEVMLERLRPAVAAREILRDSVPATTLQEALALRAQRREHA